MRNIYTWNIYRCSEGVLWDTFRCDSGILSRLIFILEHIVLCSFSDLFLFFYLFFCHLIPKKRFLDICTSSYHALTCDYREFHAYLAPCGCGIWGCSDREDSTVDQSCVHSKVRPLQDSPALLTLPTLSGFREVSGKNLKASAKCAGSWHTRVLLPILPSHQVSQLQMTQPCPCASGRR